MTITTTTRPRAVRVISRGPGRRSDGYTRP
jgi:hypothetical protein